MTVELASTRFFFSFFFFAFVFFVLFFCLAFVCTRTVPRKTGPQSFASVRFLIDRFRFVISTADREFESFHSSLPGFFSQLILSYPVVLPIKSWKRTIAVSFSFSFLFFFFFFNDHRLLFIDEQERSFRVRVHRFGVLFWIVLAFFVIGWFLLKDCTRFRSFCMDLATFYWI